jgi:hypothetical protein
MTSEICTGINMTSSEDLAKREKLVFASTVFPGKSSERTALLLVESIRAFAGSLSQAPIWCFALDSKKSFSEKTQDRLSGLGAKLIHFETEAGTPQFPFIRKALISAWAESLAQGKTDLLVWMDTDTIVLQEPKEFLLQDGKSLGCRPVHHTNIGSRYDDPLDSFWTHIYRHCRVPEDRVFAMTTHVDGTRIRPYFNAGLLAVRPERRLLQIWRDNFLRVYGAAEFQEFYKKDERYTVFMHQAVLAGTVLSTLRTDEIEELPPTYNYPLHLYGEDVTDHRPSRLEELVTFRYEDSFENPEWKKKIPAGEPLKQWISERLL